MFAQLKALARAQAENAELRRKLAIAQYAADQAEPAKKQLENYQWFYKSHVEMHTKLLNEERDRRIQAEKDALEAVEKLKRQEHETARADGAAVLRGLHPCRKLPQMRVLRMVPENQGQIRNGGNNMTDEQECVLETVRTSDLVKELQTREGVEKITVDPYETVSITVNGPTVILKIID